MLRRESDGFFNLHAVSFLTVAVFLTVFSVAYGDWYIAQITGLAPDGDDIIGPASDPVSTSDDSPPDQVVEQVSQNVEIVNEGASYASDIRNRIESNPYIGETDLASYRSKLEETRKKALELYGQSSDASDRYSSYILSEYQQEMASDLAAIERQIREIDSMLTQTAEKRDEIQTEQAIWVLEHEEDIIESIGSLEELSNRIVLNTLEGELSDISIVQVPSIDVSSVGTIQVNQDSYRDFLLSVTNNFGSNVYGCAISPSGSYASWIQHFGWFSSVGFNSLAPGQTASFTVRITPASGTQIGPYLVDFVVSCLGGVASSSMTFNIQVYSNSQTQSGTGQLTLEQMIYILQNYPAIGAGPFGHSSISNDCSDLIGQCIQTNPISCGDYPMIYSCAGPTHDCNSFENTCTVYAQRVDQSLPSFISEYVTPYVANMPQQCLGDVEICSQDPYDCPEYLYNCITGNGIAPDYGCGPYVAQCLPGSGIEAGSFIHGSNTIPQVNNPVNNANHPWVPLTIVGPSGCNGNPQCIQQATTCLTPSYIIATGLNLANFGGFGHNPVTGEICYMGKAPLYLSNIQSQAGNGIISIHFQTNNEGASRNYVAVILSNFNGHLTLNFLSSPYYDGLEDKIQEFINNLLFNTGNSSGSYITGMSLQQAEEIVNQSISIPWVLWIILFVMVICFVLFGNTLAPYNERLISSGKKALNRKDYALAIKNYNTLASSYSNDIKVKQDALEYLRQLKEKVGSSKVNLEFVRSGELPKIKTNNSVGVFSDYSRVHKMIEHALHDLKNNPKLAKSRMHLISEEYRRLIPKDREKLASSYESLVYKIRNL